MTFPILEEFSYLSSICSLREEHRRDLLKQQSTVDLIGNWELVSFSSVSCGQYFGHLVGFVSNEFLKRTLGSYTIAVFLLFLENASVVLLQCSEDTTSMDETLFTAELALAKRFSLHDSSLGVHHIP